VTPLRVMVVDDEPLAREGLVELLQTIPDVTVIGAYGDGASAIAVVDADPPDLLCVDIQMPGLSGFDVVAALDRATLPAIIFVTAHDAFAIKAFEVNALDYLLKPVGAERLAQAIDRVRAQRATRGAGYAHRVEELLRGVARPEGVGRLIVREVGQIVVIATRDVDWIEGADYYAKLHVGPKVHMLRETLSSLEGRLDPAKFLRVHRSTIVNLTRIKSVESHERGDAVVVLRDGTRIKAMRAKREELERRLEQLHDGA
jgi:two-component system LytT family response regulator